MSIAMIITLAVGIAGLALLAWGLYGRPTRGTPRCRRCWYDMSGHDTLTCPECGRVARTDRVLLRARRRWWTVALGVLLITGAAVSAQVIRIGLDKAMPTAAHILLYHKRPASERTLTRRMYEARLSAWEWRWLVRRNTRHLGTEPDPAQLVARLSLLEQIAATTRRANLIDDWQPGDSPWAIDLSGTAPALEDLLAHPDPEVVRSAWRSLKQLFPSTAHPHAMDMLLFQFQAPDSPQRADEMGRAIGRSAPRFLGPFPRARWRETPVVAFLNRLKTCASADDALAISRAGLDSEHEVIRASSLALLLLADSLEDETTQQRVLDLLHDPSYHVRRAAQLAATRSLPMDARLIQAIEDALSAESEITQRWAAELVATRGPASLRELARIPTLLPDCPVTPTLLASLHSGRPESTRVMISRLLSDSTRDAELLADLGVSTDEIADQLLAGLTGTCIYDDQYVPMHERTPHTTFHDYRIARALWVLCALDDERALSLAEGHLLAPSPLVRLAAGGALLRFGGDIDRATGLIIEGCIEMERIYLPKTVVEDLRRRGVAMSRVTRLLEDERPHVVMLGVHMLAAGGPDCARAAEPELRELVQGGVCGEATQILNGLILEESASQRTATRTPRVSRLG